MKLPSQTQHAISKALEALIDHAQGPLTSERKRQAMKVARGLFEAQIHTALKLEREAEREACASLCDAGVASMTHAFRREGAARCAEAIRRRNRDLST